MDGRRHSVDVPISRTLIALRRVRSLRDPSTSMSKLNALVDNVDWETNLNDAITLGFENSCGRVSDDHIGPRLRSSSLFRDIEQYVNGHELYYGSKNCKSMLLSSRELGAMVGNKGSTHQKSLCVEGSDARPLDMSMVCDYKALSERYHKDYGDKYFEYTSATPSGEGVEGGASCNEPDVVVRHRSKFPMLHSELDVMSRGTTGDVLSPAGSPCLSVGEARSEDVGFMESCHQGCGMSSCWSRSRKFREHILFRDVEERPLLLETATPKNIDSKFNCEGVVHMWKVLEASSKSLCLNHLVNWLDKIQWLPLYWVQSLRGIYVLYISSTGHVELEKHLLQGYLLLH